MPVSVRRISPEDWLVLRELRLASLLDAPEAFGQTFDNAAREPDSEWQNTAQVSSQGDRRAWFLAFGPDDAPLGLVQARRRPPSECLVFSMWVTPGARRSGTGRALLDAVAQWARGWSAKRIVLWVFGTNEGAQRFYEQTDFGFVREGPDAESGHAYGAVAMERRLN